MFVKYSLKEDGKVKQTIVSKPTETIKLDFFYEQLGCRLIEVVSLGESILVICDEEGLLVSQNPVFHLHNTKERNDIKIAGTFIIAKEGEDFDITSLDAVDVKRLVNDLDVSLFIFT